MMETENRAAALPPIRRMRGWRLYAENGYRFLDLRLLDNRGFLGAKGRFAGTRAKNGIDLGLLKEAPNRHTEQLRKLLAASFPEITAFRFFRNEERALAALSEVLAARDAASAASGRRAPLPPARTLRREALYDPLARAWRAGDLQATGQPSLAAVHRFFLEVAEEALLAAVPCRIIPLPCPAPFGPSVLAFAQAPQPGTAEEDELPPLLPFAACRAWEDFKSPTLPLSGGRRARSGEGAPTYTEGAWKRADRRLSPFFERRGPYLYARCTDSEWPEFRARALEGGCVLTPEWELPSIVPGEFDDGELKKLTEALERF